MKKGIHIKPGNEGKFTAFAKGLGMGVQEAARYVLAHKDKFSSARVKQANFARNAAGWKHADGGIVGSDERWRMTDDRWRMQEGGVMNGVVGENTNGGYVPPFFFQQGGATPLLMPVNYGTPPGGAHTVDTMVPQLSPQLLQKQDLDYRNKLKEIRARTPEEQAKYEDMYFAKQPGSVPHQMQWLKGFVASPQYARMLGEQGYDKSEVPQEQRERLYILDHLPVDYKTSGMEGILGQYLPPPPSGTHWDNQYQLWASDSVGRVELLPGYKPIYKGKNLQNPNTPIHEFTHATNRGGRRIGSGGIDKIFDNTHYTPLNDEKYTFNNRVYGYFDTPTEVASRIMDLRYRMNQEKIYNPFIEELTDKHIEKMLQNNSITGSKAFMELWQTIKGNTREERLARLKALLNSSVRNEGKTAAEDSELVAKFGGVVGEDTNNGGYQLQSESVGKSVGRGKVSREGYKKDSPDRFNAFNVIPSGRITMEGVPHPVMGVDNLGNQQFMLPGYQYQFPGSFVVERPVIPLQPRFPLGSPHVKTYADGGSFAKAFANARQTLGPGHLFEWNGKSYTTNVVGETGTVDEPQPPVQKTPIQNYHSWDEIKAERERQNALSDENKIVSTYANTEEPYMIVDKKNALMKLYRGPSLVKTYEVGVGANPGDAQTVTKLNNGKTDWSAGNMSTGAGVYTITNKEAHNKHYFDAPSFNMVNDQGIEVATSIHGAPIERRWRFNNGIVEDNRMSNGCINGKCYDLEDLYHNQGLSTGTKVYVLPEDAGNKFQVVDGKPVLRVTPKNAASYNSYTDSQGRVQKGQGVNRTTNTLEYKPIRTILNKSDFEKDVFQWNDLNDEEEYQNTTRPFLKGLVDNKQKIMQAAQVPSDVYNEIVKVAFGIYGTESNFGDTHSALGNLARAASKAFNRSQSSSPDVQSKYNTYGADKDSNSVGYTQIRWSQLNKDEKAALTKVGINSNHDFLDPEKAAIGTATILGVRYNQQLSPKEKSDILTYLPTKWNNRANYVDRVKKNSRYLKVEQLERYGGEKRTDDRGQMIDDSKRLTAGRALPVRQQGGAALVIPPFMVDMHMHEPKVVDTMLPQDSPVFHQKQALDTAIKNKEVLSRTPAQQAAYDKQYFARQLAEADRKERRVQEELDRREKVIEQSDAVKNNTSFFSPERRSRRNLAIASQATPERFRLFPNDVGGAGDFFDTYINPLVWVGSLAKGLGEAPLEAQQTNSVVPYFKAVGTPLVAGAIGMNPVSTVTSPVKGLFTSRGVSGQAQNIWENIVKSNAVSFLKDKSLEAGREALTPEAVERYGGERKFSVGSWQLSGGRGLMTDDRGQMSGGGRRRRMGEKVRWQDGGATYANPEVSGGLDGAVGEPAYAKVAQGETKDQLDYLLSLAQSKKYAERLSGEYDGQDVKANLDARIQNLWNTPVKFSRDLASWQQGAYVPRNYKGLIYNQGWQPQKFEPNPIFGLETPGTLYLSPQFAPGKVPAAKDATTPAHEGAHSLLDGDTFLSDKAIQMIHDATTQGKEAGRVQLNGMTFGYENEPSEMISRMQAIRYLLNKNNLYDARTQNFTDEVYDKMMNDPMIKNNSDFQAFYNALKGNDAEKKLHFIQLMNEIAARESGSGSTMAREGGEQLSGGRGLMTDDRGQMTGGRGRESEKESGGRRRLRMGRMGRWQDGGALSYQAPEGYAPSTPEQRANWNQFLNYLESRGVAGSADLDARDKRLGLQYLNAYNKAFPKTQVPESFIPTAQYENYLIRRENRFPTMTKEQSEMAFNGLPPAYKQYPLSGVDNWLGRYTSKQFYPTFRSGKALHKADGTEQVDSYDFGVNFEDYVQSKADPNVAQKYLVRQPAPVTLKQWGGGVERLPVDSWQLSGGREGGLPAYAKATAGAGYQLGGGYNGNGFVGQGNVDPFNANPYFTQVYAPPAAPAAPNPAPAAAPYPNDPGLYPYGVINPFDMDPYALQQNGAAEPKKSRTPGSPFQLQALPGYNPVVKGFAAGAPATAPNTISSTVLAAGNPKPKPDAKPKPQWGPNIGVASAVIGGLSFLNNILESHDRNRYKDWVRMRNLGDNKGPVVPGDQDNLRGDYSLNEGYFRPQRYVPTQFGAVPTAQFGGGYYDAPAKFEALPEGPMPTPIPAGYDNANTGADARGSRSSPNMPDIKANTRVRPNNQAWDAFDYYVHEKALAPHIAAGIVGNLYQESALRPDAVEKGNTGNGRGIAQWDVRNRWKGLQEWAERQKRDPYDLYTQLDYVLEEPGEGAKALKALADAQTPEEASYVFGRLYERPSDKFARWDLRAGVARKLFEGLLPDKKDMAGRSRAGEPNARFGGERGYEQGGEYEVSAEELGRILREGGEVEYL